jgi:hypothetical protein
MAGRWGWPNPAPFHATMPQKGPEADHRPRSGGAGALVEPDIVNGPGSVEECGEGAGLYYTAAGLPLEKPFPEGA